MKKVLSLILILFMGAVLIFMSGCDNTNYSVDYCGTKNSFENAKDVYAAGEKVTLYFPFIATDTDYHFYVEGADFNTDYDDAKGYIISFVMPENDVKVWFDSVNSMEYIPSNATEMLIDYYEATVATVGGDEYYELVLLANNDRSVVIVDAYWGDEEGETHKKYAVPAEVVDECYEAIEKCNFREWNSNPDYYGITGAYYVLNFKDGVTYTRVTSDHMPDNGKALMWSVGSIINRYITDEYLIEN